MSGLPERVLNLAMDKSDELERVVKARVEERKRDRFERVLRGLETLRVEEGGGAGAGGKRLLEECKILIDRC
jgi:hypothetical protein